MRTWIAVLGGLLVVQLVVAVGLNLAGHDYGAFEPTEKLLAFDRDAVDGLRIDDGGHVVTLRKVDGEWRLPDSGGFPADQESVSGLLDQLATLEKGLPVATSAGAPRRFKVADDAFERKVTLLAGETPRAVLYLGTSPGYRKVHVRPAGDEAVYAVELGSWQASAAADDWIDKSYLALDAADVKRVELPGVVLERAGDELEVAGLTDHEQSDPAKVRELLGRLTGLRIESLLGGDARPEYRQQAPALVAQVTRRDDSTLTYRFSRPEEADYYVLKRSDHERYFKVAEYAVKPLVDVQREQLVRTVSEEASGKVAHGDSSGGSRHREPQVQTQ